MQTPPQNGAISFALCRRHGTDLLENSGHIPVVGAALELVALQFKHTCDSYGGVLVGGWKSRKISRVRTGKEPLRRGMVASDKMRLYLELAVRERAKNEVIEVS